MQELQAAARQIVTSGNSGANQRGRTGASAGEALAVFDLGRGGGGGE